MFVFGGLDAAEEHARVREGVLLPTGGIARDPGARCVERPAGGESRFDVPMTAGQVYTVHVSPVPRDAHALVALYGPAGELARCEGAWGRVRLVHAAPSTGTWMVSVTVGPNAGAFVVQVVARTREEVARAIEDPLYVM